jgi:methyl-accepting chemotaxis protein
MIGRLIERLFVSVRADVSDLSKDLNQGVSATKAATNQMATSWSQVQKQVNKLTTSLQQGKLSQAQYNGQMSKLASAMKGVAGSYAQAQQQVWGYARAAKAATAASQAAFTTSPVKAFTRSTGQARMQMMNLGYQINDVGMTLATGMNPLTVLIQQGSQILQIYAGQGGIRTALSDIGRILVGLVRNAWPLLAIAAAFKGLQYEINQTTDVAVSFGDTFLAVFQVLGRKIQSTLQPVFDWIAPYLQMAWDMVVKATKAVGNFIIRTFMVVKAGVKAAIDGLPAVFKAGFWSAVAMAMEALHYLGTQFEKMMGGIAQAMNDTFGTSLDTNPIYDWVSGLEFARFSAQSTADAITEGSEALKTFRAEMEKIKNTDYMGDFFEEVKEQAIENALNRLAEGMDDVGGAAKRAAEEVKSLMEKMQEGLETAANNLAEVFGSAFERLAETGRFTFREFVMDLNKLIIRSTSELLQQELAKMFQTLATGRGGLGSTFSNLFTSLFGGGNFFGARARGGVEMPWRNFIAGEEGAELISQDGPAGARRVRDCWSNPTHDATTRTRRNQHHDDCPKRPT